MTDYYLVHTPHLLSLVVFVYVHVDMLAHVCKCRDQRWILGWLLWSLFWDEISHRKLELVLTKLAGQQAPRIHPDSQCQCLTLYVGFGNLNSGPRACLTSLLSPQAIFFKVSFVSLFLLPKPAPDVNNFYSLAFSSFCGIFLVCMEWMVFFLTWCIDFFLPDTRISF